MLRRDFLDLFEPLHSWNHFAVIKDLISRHPIAKPNKSTLLEDVYNTSGKSVRQKSDKVLSKTSL